MQNKDFSGRTSWIMAGVLAAGIFLAARPAIAQIIELPGITSVGTEVKDGYSQIFFEAGGKRTLLTVGAVNSKMPVFKDKFVSWASEIGGQGQIFLSDTLSGSKVQLTFSGTNLNPKVDEKGRVVYEGWDGKTWQIFFFDGVATRQLTSGDTSLNPDLAGEFISYGRRDVTGTWRAVVYSIAEGKSADVTVGEKARSPRIIDGDIYLAYGTGVAEKFPLSVSQLFLLDLVPLTATESASPSGITASPQPFQSPSTASESSSSGETLAP